MIILSRDQNLAVFNCIAFLRQPNWHRCLLGQPLRQTGCKILIHMLYYDNRSLNILGEFGYDLRHRSGTAGGRANRNEPIIRLFLFNDFLLLNHSGTPTYIDQPAYGSNFLQKLFAACGLIMHTQRGCAHRVQRARAHGLKHQRDMLGN